MPKKMQVREGFRDIHLVDILAEKSLLLFLRQSRFTYIRQHKDKISKNALLMKNKEHMHISNPR